MIREIQIKQYDYDKKAYEEVGEPVSIYLLAKSINREQFAKFMEDWTNNFSVSYGEGQRIGRLLHSAHRTLQRSIIVVLTGIISGLSEQVYTDPRNEHSIALAKDIKALYEEKGAGMMV